jgi:LPXTG-motif cell wall-anchored protein
MMRILKLAMGMLAVAAFAVAQNADKNTAGPTANDYRLQVIQPAEGATITGRNVQVIVDLNARQQLAIQEKRDSDSMPQARVTVFLDNASRGTLHDEHNVMNIEDVAPGPHTLILEARNLSGEIIDHKEVRFVSVERAATNRPSKSTAPAPPAANPPVAASSTSSSGPSAATPGMSGSSSGSMGSMGSMGSTGTGMMSRSNAPANLPQTGSDAPLLAVAGFGLIGLGLAVFRRV